MGPFAVQYSVFISGVFLLEIPTVNVNVMWSQKIKHQDIFREQKNPPHYSISNYDELNDSSSDSAIQLMIECFFSEYWKDVFFCHSEITSDVSLILELHNRKQIRQLRSRNTFDVQALVTWWRDFSYQSKYAIIRVDFWILK